MPYPPERGRRRKLCRTRILAAIGLVAACAAGGFSYWQETRFPAHTIPLKGTPVKLRVQDGVEPRELRAVTQGLRLVDRFMKRELRRSVRRPVEARIARHSACRPFQSSSGDTIGEADDGFLCVATQNLHWRWILEKDPPAAVAVSAHEFVHVLQAELGCLEDGRGQKFRWLVEGMAEEIAWSALVSAERVTDGRVARMIRSDALPAHGLSGRGLYPLAAYERGDGADREYALWHLAVRRLLRTAVREDAVPRAHPELALRRFCERVGRGVEWRTAFAATFGEPVERFYAEFEAYRERSNA